MKKVLLLLCALFAGVTGAWANVGDVVKALTQISPQKAYTVNTNGRGSWTIAEGGTELKSSGNGAYGLKEPTDASNPRQQWAFVSYEEATYLYNVGEKKFILKENKKGVANATHGTPVNLETYTSGQMAGWGEVYEDFQAGEFYFCAQMGMFDETTKAYINFGGSMNTTIDGWGPGNTSYDPKCGIDAGNALKIVEAADFDPTAAIAALENYFHPSATVVFVVSDENGQVVETSEKIPSIVGETIKELPASMRREFCSYKVPETTIAAGDNTIKVTVSYTLPFEVSKDYANAKWYFAKIRGSKWLRADESQKDGSGRYLTNDTNEKTDVYQWAFVGNPYSNFVILNKAHEGKVLYLGSQPVMQAVADPTADNAAQWAIKANGDGFNLRNLTGANLYINDNSNVGNLGTWNNANAAADAGGKWNIEAVPDDYASYVEADIKPWFEKAGGYFELKTEVVTANQAKYEAALQQCSVGTYQELLAVVQDDNNIRYPETGYYRLKNFYYPTRYLAYVGSNLTAIEDEGLTAASVVRLTRTSEGKYLVSLQGLSADAPAQSAKVAMSEAGAELLATVAAPGLGAFTNGNRYGALHCDKNYNIVGWEVAANATRWIVEEATEVALALNDGENGSYYATFCAPFEATVNGAKAYTMARNGDYMVATEVENIAAGIPVLLKSDAAAVKLALGTGYAAKPSAETGLTGTYVDASVQGATDYVLGKGSEGVAFYHWEGETLTANHAYVVAEPGVKCFAIDWAGETAIQGIESEAENQTIYNISGQRVQKAVKGLYIVNGKKVMVK